MNSLKKPKKIEKTIILLGENGVGKSTLLKAFTKERFNPEYCETIVANFYHKEITVQNDQISLGLWDTNGGELTQLMIPPFIYKTADFFIIVLSYDKRSSLETMKNYQDLILKFYTDKMPNILILVNKIDISKKEFKLKEVVKQCDHQVSVCEFSAKDIKGVKILFRDLGMIMTGRKVRAKSLANSSCADSMAETNDTVLIPLRSSFRIEEEDMSSSKLFEPKDSSGKCCK